MKNYQRIESETEYRFNTIQMEVGLSVCRPLWHFSLDLSQMSLGESHSFSEEEKNPFSAPQQTKDPPDGVTRVLGMRCA